jgi:predicted ester cyclase
MPATNKQLVARLLTDVLDTGDLAPIDALVHPDYLNHEAAPGTPGGRDGFRHTVAFLRGGFSDLRFVVDDMIAEGDRVVVRCRFEGTHDGTFLGLTPTGRRVSIQHVHIFRIEAGMVAEHWACRDDVSGLRQLGAVPEGAER